METVPHSLNWTFGWWLVLSAFATGAALGLFFHQEDFLGGYTTFRRRLTRLGHISQAALGMMNVLYGLSPLPLASTWQGQGASVAFVAGGVSMPLVCYLSGWKTVFRHFFFIPVTALALAVLFTLHGGRP
jgi:hypothetical protein